MKGMKSLKKINIVLILLIGTLLMGCSNEFAKEQYDSDELIAQNTDRYTKSMSVMNTYDNSVTLTVGKFDGRQCVWSADYDEDQEVRIKLSFTLAAGKAKLVHVDEDGNVTTIVECTPDSEVEDLTSYTVAMKEGCNRLKVVGYDCEELKLSVEIKSW